METILEVKDLRVRYGKFEAVKGVSFKVGKGEIFGIVGESGSGKSTIAKALIGLEAPFSGQITLNTQHSALGTQHSLQMIFQDAVGSLNPRMTVRQTLSEVLSIYSQPSEILKSTNRRIDESTNLLTLVGLSSAVLDQYPRELSGGQCQRVSIARALATRPEILIADEPVSALDVSVQARILNLLRELRDSLGLTIVLIAHDLAVVRNVCDHIAVMERGLFVDHGDAAEVFAHPKSDYTKRLLEAVPDVARELARREEK